MSKSHPILKEIMNLSKEMFELNDRVDEHVKLSETYSEEELQLSKIYIHSKSSNIRVGFVFLRMRAEGCPFPITVKVLTETYIKYLDVMLAKMPKT